MSIPSFIFGVGIGITLCKYNIIDTKQDVLSLSDSAKETEFKIFGISVLKIDKQK
jgi:hypothetical protein